MRIVLRAVQAAAVAALAVLAVCSRDARGGLAVTSGVSPLGLTGYSNVAETDGSSA